MRCKACSRVLNQYAKEEYCTVCIAASKDKTEYREHEQGLLTEALIDPNMINSTGSETGHGYYFDNYQYSVESF